MLKQAKLAKHAAIGARVRLIRKGMGLTQEAFGRLFVDEKSSSPLAKQSVSAWERGKSIPARVHLARMAELGGRTVDWILTGRDPSGAATAVHYIGKGRAIRKMGTTDRSTAGAQALALRQRADPEMVHTHFPCGPRAFALQVADASMEPVFHAGDIVVIDPDVAPQPGDFVWCELKDEPHALFRRYRPKTYCRGRVATIDLVPLNEDWPTHTVNLKTQGRIEGTLTESAKQWARRPHPQRPQRE